MLGAIEAAMAGASSRDNAESIRMVVLLLFQSSSMPDGRRPPEQHLLAGSGKQHKVAPVARRLTKKLGSFMAAHSMRR